MLYVTCNLQDVRVTPTASQALASPVREGKQLTQITQLVSEALVLRSTVTVEHAMVSASDFCLYKQGCHISGPGASDVRKPA